MLRSRMVAHKNFKLKERFLVRVTVSSNLFQMNTRAATLMDVAQW